MPLPGTGEMALGVQASTAELVGHLYRRAGFGPRPGELSAATAAGYSATVQSLVDGLGAPDPGADTIAAPTLSPPVPRRERKTLGEAERKQLHEEFGVLTAWWLARMIATTNPLKEKLPFLLHGHFPTAISKVHFPIFMYGQNQLFRAQGRGDFGTLTQAVATDPAMLIWLDADSNKASNPNENFARELMERFTMGVGTYHRGRRAGSRLLLHRLAPRPRHRGVHHREREPQPTAPRPSWVHRVNTGTAGDRPGDPQSRLRARYRPGRLLGATWPTR